jgi:hypothetical protein
MVLQILIRKAEKLIDMQLNLGIGGMYEKN